MSFVSDIAALLPGEATTSQQHAIRQLESFIFNKGTNNNIFLLKGYAGTGKTTLTASIVQWCKKKGISIVLLAPTGRAAKVMSKYAHQPASTIHKHLYRLSEDGYGEMKFQRRPNTQQHTLYLVDEASMISEDKTFGRQGMLSELIQFVFEQQNNKLIFIGDDAQLPPISQTDSPALQKEVIQYISHDVPYEAVLSDVVRQEKQSGILYNATLLRNIIATQKNKLSFHTKGFTDFFRMTGERLEDGLRYAYDHFGTEETIVICRSNQAATQYNKYIRHTIFFSENELDAGDLIMVVKNNYRALPKGHPLQFLANGEFMEVLKVLRIEEAYGHRFADVEVTFPDQPNTMNVTITILLDTLHSNQAALEQTEWKEMLAKAEAEYAHIPNKDERYQAIQEDKYLQAVQVKFAYALTCHKSQGGQWDIVFIDQGYVTEETINTEWFRWVYTAVTRGKKQVFLVNFNEKFYLP
ncbi:MAG: AAA family ATPase [Cytophagaceae bacterium]